MSWICLSFKIEIHTHRDRSIFHQLYNYYEWFFQNNKSIVLDASASANDILSIWSTLLIYLDFNFGEITQFGWCCAPMFNVGDQNQTNHLLSRQFEWEIKDLSFNFDDFSLISHHFFFLSMIWLLVFWKFHP